MSNEHMPTDDGERAALRTFLRNRDENLGEVLDVLKTHGQFWKARVFLELLWEFERLKFRINGLEK